MTLTNPIPTCHRHRLPTIDSTLVFHPFWRGTVFTVASLRASSVLNLEALPRHASNLHAFRAPTRPPGRFGA